MVRKGQYGPKKKRYSRTSGSKSINKRRKRSALIDRRLTRMAEGRDVGPAHAYQKKAQRNPWLRREHGL